MKKSSCKYVNAKEEGHFRLYAAAGKKIKTGIGTCGDVIKL